MDNRTYKAIHQEVFGRTDYEPIVVFYDHAVRSEELTAKSGRPRYVEVPYCKIKPTHPDLKVRDEKSKPASEELKKQFPRQWEAYQKTKSNELEFKPVLQAIPGMSYAIFRELQELDIHNAEDLANYAGDLGEIDYLRQLAKRIMEVSLEARNLRAKRDSVGETDTGQPDNCAPARQGTETARPAPVENNAVSYAGRIYTLNPAKPKEKGPEETFSYSFQV